MAVSQKRFEDYEDITFQERIPYNKNAKAITSEQLKEVQKIGDGNYAKELKDRNYITHRGAMVGGLIGGVYSLWAKKNLVIGVLFGAVVGNFVSKKLFKNE